VKRPAHFSKASQKTQAFQEDRAYRPDTKAFYWTVTWCPGYRRKTDQKTGFRSSGPRDSGSLAIQLWSVSMV